MPETTAPKRQRAKKNQRNKSKAKGFLRFRWKRFRGFRDTGWVEIRPLTILIGPNSSGKTSLFCPLLMMKQTIESADTSTRLRTKGEYVDVGFFKDLIYGHNPKGRVAFGIRTIYEKRRRGEKVEGIGDYPPGSISLTFKQGKDIDDIELESFALKDVYDRTMLRRRLRQSGKYSFDFYTPLRKTIGQTIWRAISKDQPKHFLFDSRAITVAALPQIINSEKAGDSIVIKDFKFPGKLPILIATLEFGCNQVRSLLSDIFYIGPLRQPPRRFYESVGERPSSVGPMGQYTSNVLLRMKKEESLDQVNAWLRAFDIDETIHCEEYAVGVFSVFFKRGRSLRDAVNIADTGFGVSQVLPLLTQGLSMKANGILIAEQPEIHLNPRLQGRLADFFVHLVESDKVVVVETHSEHLLLRLRTLVAQGKIDPSEVALYFLEKDGQMTTIRQVPVDGNGHIDRKKWPRGFFEDSLQESYQLAAAQIKKKEDQE